MLSKTEIIEIHGKIIVDLLLLLERSEKIAKLSNNRAIVYNGIIILNHVFNMNIIHDTPKDILLHNCQKGSFCYLEYIEQACDKKIVANMDFSVIYSFICKQTMNFLNNYDSMKASPSIYNVLNILQKNMDTIVLLNLDLPLKILIKITDIYLVHFAKLLYRFGNDRKHYYCFMSIVFEKIKAARLDSHNCYFVFLNTLYMTLCKLKNKKMVELNASIGDNLLLATIMECDFEKEQSIKKMVKEFFNLDTTH
jgi:hypothetical protein